MERFLVVSFSCYEADENSDAALDLSLVVSFSCYSKASKYSLKPPRTRTKMFLVVSFSCYILYFVEEKPWRWKLSEELVVSFSCYFTSLINLFHRENHSTPIR